MTATAKSGLPWPLSVWRASAPALVPYPALATDISTEVAIVGAGYTGLSCAAALAARHVDCVVLEAEQPGYGASGRNGGMAVTRYKPGWTAMCARHGVATSQRLQRLALEGIDLIENLTREHALDNDFRRHGHLTPAASRKASASLHADIRVMRDNFNDTGARLMHAAEVAERTGTKVYLDGYYDPRSAGIHPYRHAVALAAAVAAGGTPIHGDSPVLAIEQDTTGYLLRTGAATVRARKLVYATNGYTDFFPIHADLGRRIISVSSAAIATGPLSAAQAVAILPQGTLVTDTRHLVNYFRKTPCGRLLFGGRGSLTGNELPRTYRGLEQRLVDTFPTLRDIGIDYRWSGRVAISMDDFPHIGALGTHAFFAMGYGGRGVVLSHVLGSRLADCITHGLPDLGPMSSNPFHPIPLHAFRIPGMNMVASYYKMKDALGR